MKKALAIALVFVAVFATLGRIYLMKNSNEKGGGENSGEQQRYMSIDAYVTSNISLLSPIKESLGGKFYVTKISSENGNGIVEYEDGHSAYVADFTYSVSSEGKPEIKSFKIRE